MTAGKFDIACEHGADLDVVVTVKNLDGLPAGLTFWRSQMHIRAQGSDVDPLLECSTENGRLSHTNSDGTISLNLSSNDTASLPIGEHVYDLKLFTLGDRVSVRLIEGLFKVT